MTHKAIAVLSCAFRNIIVRLHRCRRLKRATSGQRSQAAIFPAMRLAPQKQGLKQELDNMAVGWNIQIQAGKRSF